MSRRRAVLGGSLQGLGYSAGTISAAVIVGSRHGIGVVGVVLGTGVLGRVMALMLERRGEIGGFAVRCRLAAASGVAVAVAAVAGPWWLAAVAFGTAACFVGMVSSALMHAFADRIPVVSASGMASQAVGTGVGGVTAAASLGAAAAVAVVLAGAIAVLPLVAGAAVEERGEVGARPAGRVGPQMVFAFLLALASYGPLAVFSALVTLHVGAAWTGPAYATYAAGSWVVVAAPRIIPRSRAGIAACAAAGSAVWVTGLHEAWFVLAGRFVAGVLMFAAQGAVLQRASVSAGREGVAGAIVGLGAGEQIAAVWCGAVAEESITLMTVIAVAATTVLGAGAGFSDRRGRGS